MSNRIYDEVKGHTDIKGAPKQTLLAIAYRANDEDRVCWPSHKTIANEMGLGVSTVKRAIETLVSQGYLYAQTWDEASKEHPRVAARFTSSNVYTVRPVEDWGSPERARGVAQSGRGVAQSGLGGSPERALNQKKNQKKNQNLNWNLPAEAGAGAKNQDQEWADDCEDWGDVVPLKPTKVDPESLANYFMAWGMARGFPRTDFKKPRLRGMFKNEILTISDKPYHPHDVVRSVELFWSEHFMFNFKGTKLDLTGHYRALVGNILREQVCHSEQHKAAAWGLVEADLMPLEDARW